METGAAIGSRIQQQEEEAAGEEGLMAQQVAQSKKMKKVMVAIDESEGSFCALQWALDNLVNAAAVTPSNEPSQESGMFVLVHVQPPFQYHVYPAGPGGAAFFGSSSIIESVRKAQAENAAALLSRALQMCKTRMIKAESLILEGDPKEMICQATEQVHVDVLVVGSRGLGMVKRAFLGSVSDYCAHHAKCPILIVKPPKDAK
ncbi:hypothetical protein Tsubulata_017765 [Turnera subulata]|uniref:UspA domain-containing protein n=1 Tax=Turnera subulata TaxID=218843 RepID=A0A9Q0FIF5_9ROSI|nr:hypothetical protein Tsubulata_017765 [Turnera subulata]